jgi:hypothetical protein
MFTYRFRMNFEEQDGFRRDIELRSDQTFLDFYHIISENLTLDKSLECAFFLCDHFYRKRKRIFQPGNTDTKKAAQDADLPDNKLFMDECILSDYIDDPHQKFIFIYDIAKDWNFYIELLKILPAAPTQQYPKISGSVGGIPIEISRKPVVLPGVMEDEDDLESVTTDDDIEEPELIMDMDGDDENEESHEYEEGDMDSMGDSSFYDDSIEINEEFDEGK